MKKVLVFADIHMTVEGTRIGGRDPLSMMRAALAHAMSRHGDAEAIILLGDLTNTGHPAEYARLTEALSRVEIPVIPMTGNTDNREALLAAFPNAPVTKAGHIQGIIDLPRHRLITLDSLDAPPYRKTRHAGALCPDRMAWLLRAMESRGDRHPVVFVHHPPMKLGMPAHDAIRLTDGADLMEYLGEVPGVYLICGHVHRALAGVSRAVPYSVIGSPTEEFALRLTGEEIIPSDNPGCYGVVLLQKNGVVVHNETVPLAP